MPTQRCTSPEKRPCAAPAPPKMLPRPCFTSRPTAPSPPARFSPSTAALGCSFSVREDPSPESALAIPIRLFRALFSGALYVELERLILPQADGFGLSRPRRTVYSRLRIGDV